MFWYVLITETPDPPELYGIAAGFWKEASTSEFEQSSEDAETVIESFVNACVDPPSEAIIHLTQKVVEYPLTFDSLAET